MHPDVGGAVLIIAPASVHIAAGNHDLVGDLLPATDLPSLYWHKGTYGLLLATDEHLLYLLLARALALPYHGFPLGGNDKTCMAQRGYGADAQAARAGRGGAAGRGK